PPRVRWTSVSADPVFAADGRFLGYEGTARDVTIKKQAQLRLQYLTRMYAALSDVERDVSGLDDVDEAIAAVCRLTYDVGGLVRVIFFAHDAQAAALVVTHYAGSNPSAITQLDLSKRADKQDAGLPVVLAASERRAQVSQDYCGDQRVARFHELARRRGINASLALPVCVQGRLVGVLGLYARELDWFDDELVVLSERIVASLTQAIDAIESRAAKRAAELAHARAQRFYATLGEVGEAALRSRSAEELLTTTCRILHETGGLVGVSYYQSDASNKELVLTAGAGASTPAKMDLAADGADPAGQRPSFQAWFSRATVVANDYLGLDTTRQFHDYYRARGVAASMITPVPGEGAHCHGLLALMAAARNWFDAELVALTERIAVVLGQALSRMALEHSKEAAETELARSEARYRQFAALAGDWHWESDSEHRFTYMSDNLSVHEEQQLGERIGQIICSPPCTPEPEQLARYRALLEAHEPIRDLLLHVTGLPLRPWWRVNAAPRFDAQGTFLGYCGTTREVTPEITAELARQQAEEHFSRLARLSVDWYWETDADGRITHVSESYTRMTGIPLSDVQGLVAFQPGAADASGDERALGEREIAALVAARQPFYDKIYLSSQRVAPGQEEWRITSGEPVFDSDGVFLGYRGTARAINAPEPSKAQGKR
ncbi:MAG: GAF domain-containing protein, partial [Burkholderiaceae bacterium]|nr:GAF domain-containing protein [Burkholderiaceae bacterium]